VKVQDKELAEARAEVRVEEEAERVETVPVRDRQDIVYVRVVAKRLSIRQESPVILLNARNAVQQWSGNRCPGQMCRSKKI